MTLFQPFREQVAPEVDKETVQNQFFFPGCTLKVQYSIFHH